MRQPPYRGAPQTPYILAQVVLARVIDHINKSRLPLAAFSRDNSAIFSKGFSPENQLGRSCCL